MKWISWLLDNVWAAVIIVGVIAQMFKAVMKRRDGGIPDADDSAREEQGFGDADLEEQTRRIRADIERRKQQRAGSPYEIPPAQPQPEPVEAVAPVPVREIEVPPAPVKAASRAAARRQAEILEEQAALEEKLSEARVLSLAAQKRREFEVATADRGAEARTAARISVLEDLRSPAALRRAFVLREVLGPPVALRR